MENKTSIIIILLVLFVFLFGTSLLKDNLSNTGGVVQKGRNLALNKEVSANSCLRNCCSERCFYNPSLAVDGNDYTKWWSNMYDPGKAIKGRPHTWSIDLGKNYKIEKIRTRLGYYNHNYKLQYSKDMEHWETFEEKIRVNGDVVHEVLGIKARYWRLLFTYSQNNGRVTLFEFGVYQN